MLTGIQLPNHTRRLSELEVRRLEALKPEVVRAFDYVTEEQLSQVRGACGARTVIITHRPARTIYPASWTQDLLYAYDRVTRLEFTPWFAPCNEPNHPDGPYPRLTYVEDFKRDYGALVGEIDRVWPGVPVISPNLAVGHRDLEWATKCQGLFNWHRYIGVNAYWQYDHHLDPEWGLRIGQFRKLFPYNEFVVLEMGDASPDTTPFLKCQRMKAVLRAMRTLGYVSAVSIFILGYDETAPQTWEGFVYRPEDLRALRNDGPSNEELRSLAKAIAGEEGLPWEIVDRLIETESGYDPTAVSPAGAEGLMQLMPEFYHEVDRFNPKANLEAGMRALAQYLKRYGWDYARTLAAYNWGPGNVNQAEEDFGWNWWLGLPEETKRYIRAILFPE